MKFKSVTENKVNRAKFVFRFDSIKKWCKNICNKTYAN